MQHLFLAVIAIVLAMLPVSVARAIPIVVGHPLEISFASLEPSSTVPAANQGGFSLNLSPTDLFDPGEAMRFEMFEDENLGLPISFGAIGFNIVLTNNSGSSSDQTGVTVINAWQDLAGSFRVTMLAGSVELDNAVVSAFRDQQLYRLVARPPAVAAVLEPSSASLAALAALLLFGIGETRRRRQRRSALA